MDASIILNVVIGCFLYNIVLKSIGKALIDSFVKTKTVEKELQKSFKEKLAEKVNDQN